MQVQLRKSCVGNFTYMRHPAQKISCINTFLHLDLYSSQKPFFQLHEEDSCVVPGGNSGVVPASKHRGAGPCMHVHTHLSMLRVYVHVHVHVETEELLYMHVPPYNSPRS